MSGTAQLSDVPAIRGLLGRAYATDPLTEWIFGPENTHAAAAWYGLFVEQYVALAQASVIREGDEIVAAALWRLPADPPLTSDGTPGIAGLLRALVGPRRSEEISDALHGISQIMPSGDHAYLNFLAVEPGRWRSGLGARVLAPVLEAAGAAGLFVHLETSNPANHAFYAAQGFVETGRMTLGAGGPELRALRLSR